MCWLQTFYSMACTVQNMPDSAFHAACSQSFPKRNNYRIELDQRNITTVLVVGAMQIFRW